MGSKNRLSVAREKGLETKGGEAQPRRRPSKIWLVSESISKIAQMQIASKYLAPWTVKKSRGDDNGLSCRPTLGPIRHDGRKLGWHGWGLHGLAGYGTTIEQMKTMLVEFIGRATLEEDICMGCAVRWRRTVS